MALDKASVKSIVSALTRHDVDPTLNRLKHSMLLLRAIAISVGDVWVTRLVDQGSPYGGVLSPLLWDFAVDELVRIPITSGFNTIAYANDITVPVDGRFEHVLCN